MIPFIAGLWNNPLIKYGSMVLLALWLLRIYVNEQTETEYWKGIANQTENEYKADKIIWERREKQFDQVNTELAARLSIAVNDRTKLIKVLEGGLSELDGKVAGLKPAIDKIPATELDATIKSKLASLR